MDNTRIRILLADDHELYLDGLKGLLQTQDIYEVVDEAHNGIELVNKASLHEPDIILTDLCMPQLNGTGAIHKIITLLPDCKCVVLTNYENDLSIIEALEAGAKGYITKNMPRLELFTALEHISRGYPYFCQATSAKMIRLIGKSPYNPFTGKARAEFSEQDKKIILLICLEKTNQEMADTLFLSIRTIENIRYRIYKKMEVKTSAGVAVYAIKYGLLSLDDLDYSSPGHSLTWT